MDNHQHIINKPSMYEDNFSQKINYSAEPTKNITNNISDNVQTTASTDNTI